MRTKASYVDPSDVAIVITVGPTRATLATFSAANPSASLDW